MCEEALRSKDAQILRCHSLSLTCCNYNSEFDSHDPVRLVSIHLSQYVSEIVSADFNSPQLSSIFHRAPPFFDLFFSISSLLRSYYIDKEGSQIYCYSLLSKDFSHDLLQFMKCRLWSKWISFKSSRQHGAIFYYILLWPVRRGSVSCFSSQRWNYSRAA
uniref:Uncharacterized protein n=1 Tax=Salix viminalis TaxID=40686 RepID=A0A6N2MA52_SALVM